MPFAENLNYLMEGHMLSKYRLAKDLGCSQTTVAYWLDGTRMPHRKMQEKIAARFGISVEELNGDRFPELKSGGEMPDWNRKEEKPADEIGELTKEEIEYIRWFREKATEKERAIVRTIISGENDEK